MSIIFLEKSFIIAAILNVKNKYFDDNFVDFKELNYITSLVQHIFNNNKLNIIITDQIDKNNFQINEVIVLNNSSIDDIRNYYRGYCPINALKIIWNEQLILDKIVNFKLLEIENVRSKILSLNYSNNQKNL